MALPLLVDSLDSVPENLRSEYTEENGKYRLSIDGYEDPKNLKSALEKERQAAREAAKAKAELERKFEGFDPEEYQTLKKEREALEEARLKAEGKADELAQKRTEKAIEAKNKEIEKIAAQVEAERKRTDSYRNKLLDRHVLAAVSGVVHDDAKADALLAAREIFTLNDEGDPVQIDQDGEIVLGKDGQNPFSPSEWIEAMKDKKRHWFPSFNSGGGATGGRLNTSGVDLSNMSPVERMKYARKHQQASR
jgi:hypothetical protein